jgi:hypothetical protein
VPASFSQPFMYWVGIDLHTTDPREIEAYHRFYGGTHLPEVLAANPGFTVGHRYELVGPDDRGVPAPQFLAVYEMSDEASAQTYIRRNDGPPEGRPDYTPGPPVWKQMEPKWRMIWRRFTETGPATGTPASLFVVGIDPPAGVDATGLAEFDHFYTDVHVPEVVARASYTRATRHERFRDFLHPAPGCPRYCAVYEADGATTARLGEGPPGPVPSPGPAVWHDRTTRWRLVYRRLPA